MGRLWRFIIIAFVLEAIAIPVNAGHLPGWVMDIIIGLAIVYGIVLAALGWRKQANLALPPAMTGRVVRKRHWRLF